MTSGSKTRAAMLRRHARPVVGDLDARRALASLRARVAMRGTRGALAWIAFS